MATKPEQCDVLLYHKAARRMGIVWNDQLPKGAKASMVPMQHRHVIQPRLSFCPAKLWPLVSGTKAYKDAKADGLVRELAGHDGELEAAISGLNEGSLIDAIELSAGIKTLDRIQAIESASASPRINISEAIELRKNDLAVEMAKAKRERDHDRRASQRRMSRRNRAA